MSSRKTLRTLLVGTLAGLSVLAALPDARSAFAQSTLAPPNLYEVGPDRGLRGLAVSLVFSGNRRLGDGYRQFDRDLVDDGGAVEVSQDLLSLGHSAQLALGLGFQGEDYRNAGGGQLNGTLNTRGYYALAVARFRAAAIWQPYVGLAGGLERGELALHTGAQELDSKAWGLFGRASLGLRFAPRRLTLRTQGGNPVFAVAFGLEVAGTLGTPLRFEYRAEPESQGAGDSDRIPTGTVSLGSVSRHGVHGRGLVSLVF